MKKLYYKNLVDAQYMQFHFGIETYVKELGVDKYYVKKKYWGVFDSKIDKIIYRDKPFLMPEIEE